MVKRSAILKSLRYSGTRAITTSRHIRNKRRWGVSLRLQHVLVNNEPKGRGNGGDLAFLKPQDTAINYVRPNKLHNNKQATARFVQNVFCRRAGLCTVGVTGLRCWACCPAGAAAAAAICVFRSLSPASWACSCSLAAAAPARGFCCGDDLELAFPNVWKQHKTRLTTG